jgi:predicted RNase H-like HicB family nuclease
MSELVFLVEEDVDGGFTARVLGQSIFTQGENREELVRNIRDAVRCHFDSPEELPKVLRLHYVRDEVTSL